MKPVMLDGVPAWPPKAGDVYLAEFADRTHAVCFLIQDKEKLRVVWVASERTEKTLYMNTAQYDSQLWDHKSEKYIYLGTLQGASILNKLASLL